MDFVKLSYFHSAATYSNFSMAAQECHIAQTAMSRHIADIEKEIGVELFKRFPKKVILTPAGELFFHETKEILRKYNEIVTATQDTASGSIDRLNIAFGFYERSLLFEYVLPFVEKYPRISVTIQQYPYDLLIQELKKGNCDVGFCPPNWAATLENTRSVALRTSTNHIALSKTHPLTKYSELSAEQLEGQVIILPKYNEPLDDFKRLCDHYGIKPKKTVHVNTLGAMISMIETNIGVSIVPSYIIEDYSYIEFRPFNYTLLRDKRHVALCLEPVVRSVTSLFLDEIAEKIESESRLHLNINE